MRRGRGWQPRCQVAAPGTVNKNPARCGPGRVLLVKRYNGALNGRRCPSTGAWWPFSVFRPAAPPAGARCSSQCQQGQGLPAGVVSLKGDKKISVFPGFSENFPRDSVGRQSTRKSLLSWKDPPPTASSGPGDDLALPFKPSGCGVEAVKKLANEAARVGVLLALCRHVVCPLQALGFEDFEYFEPRGLVSCPMVARG